MIDGKTKLIAHIGYPTESFKAPMIYNPFFEARKINAVVVPMGCKGEDYAAFLKLVFRLTNIHGALDHHASQGHDARARRRGLGVGEDRRRLQRGADRRARHD